MDIIWYAEEMVQALEACREVHGEVVRQPFHLVPFHM